MYTYKMTLLRVIDGDTIVAMVDLGFSIHRKTTIRLLEIDTPEIRGPDSAKGFIAKKKLEDFLTNKHLTIISTSVDSFGRALGLVYADGQYVNGYMKEDMPPSSNG